MCVLILLHRVVPGHPVVVGANRDEAYDRGGEPPARDGAVVAPRDPRAGGTWIGARDSGLFVGITNRSWLPADPARRSRGLLCREALDREDAAAVRELVERETRARAYNPFHLLYADDARAFVTWHGPEGTRTEELAPGVHVLTNRHETGVLRLPELEAQLAGRGLPDVAAALERVLPDHAPRLPGGEPLCVHRPGRGTVSSSVLAFDARGLRLFRHANGPPCTTPWRGYA
jgi:hypothetical protein